MGTVGLSDKERRRLEILSRVRDGEITLAKAAELMKVSARQAKRIKQRYLEAGDEGLAHKLRGRRSNNASNPVQRERILELYRTRYSDFGPTLTAEYLEAEYEETVSVETLRLWLIHDGLWRPRKKRGERHREWRPRMPHKGELVQMDGSHHDWFEGRRERCVLMVMIDDATNDTTARFFEGETTAAAMRITKRYVQVSGIPRALYVDRDSIYRTSRDATVDEELAGEPPLTQFGMAMEDLGVEIVIAYSPQAKGRVERMNGVLQDRLVKALRLAEISDIRTANDFLEEVFLPDLNRRFASPPRKPGDLHRPLPENLPLDRILGFRESRVVRSDWTIQWRSRWFQLTKENQSKRLVRQSVAVIEELDGRLHVMYRGESLPFQELMNKPDPKPRKWSGRPRKNWTPAPDHPWRQSYHARYPKDSRNNRGMDSTKRNEHTTPV